MSELPPRTMTLGAGRSYFSMVAFSNQCETPSTIDLSICDATKEFSWREPTLVSKMTFECYGKMGFP